MFFADIMNEKKNKMNYSIPEQCSQRKLTLVLVLASSVRKKVDLCYSGVVILTLHLSLTKILPVQLSKSTVDI